MYQASLEKNNYTWSQIYKVSIKYSDTSLDMCSSIQVRVRHVFTEILDSLSPEKYKNCLDTVLYHMLWRCPARGGSWTTWPTVVSYNLTHSVLLWYSVDWNGDKKPSRDPMRENRKTFSGNKLCSGKELHMWNENFMEFDLFRFQVKWMDTYYSKTINICTHYEHMHPWNTSRICNPEKASALASSQHQDTLKNTTYPPKNPKQTNKQITAKNK